MHTMPPSPVILHNTRWQYNQSRPSNRASVSHDITMKAKQARPESDEHGVPNDVGREEVTQICINDYSDHCTYSNHKQKHATPNDTSDRGKDEVFLLPIANQTKRLRDERKDNVLGVDERLVSKISSPWLQYHETAIAVTHNGRAIQP